MKVEGDNVLFSPTVEDGMMKHALDNMKAIEYKGQAAFLPKKDIEERKKLLKESGDSFYVYVRQKP